MPSLAPAPLHLFLGWAPQVGKTHALLSRAQMLRARGDDVVVGWAETRGRPETDCLLAGLERVPPRRFDFRGLSTREMDVDAVLARRPTLVVVDDLAHVNVPGSHHRRRHQDVRALLDAGIGVLTALDIRQLESLRDVVARLTAREEWATVPDAFLDLAGQVVCLDLAVPDLLRRWEVEPPEGLDEGLTPEALTGLRELALREVAERLARRSAGGGPAPEPRVGGRLMVALSSLSPRAATLLRRGSRLAGRLNTTWFVVYVETPEEAPERIRPEVERTLLRHVETARELGAEVVRLRAADPVPALLDFGRAHGVSGLMVGRSRRWSWRRLWQRPPGSTWRLLLGDTPDARLLREARDFDVYVVAEEEV